MKNFFLILLTLACGATVIAGSIYWNEKTAVSGSGEISVSPKENDTVKKESKEPEEPAVSIKPSEKKRLLGYTGNWPEQAQEAFAKALDSGESFRILLAGSDTKGEADKSWSTLVESKLKETYGEHIEVIVKHYPMTSREFIDEGLDKELAELEPDMTLLEPFTLMDNGVVEISSSHSHLDDIAETLSDNNPGHTLVIQPPYPLYQASYYPVQVDALKKHAESNYLYTSKVIAAS